MKASYVAEFAGTAFLLAVITGSGIAGDALSQGHQGVALLANSLATGAGLLVLLSVLGPVSGAHLNPLVSLGFMWRGELSIRMGLAYMACQFSGAFAGVLAAHAMYGMPLLQLSSRSRSGLPMMLSEFVSTIALLAVVFLGIRHARASVPLLVACTVMTGYWFTSSTFFANPAVTLARVFSDTFVGIRPEDLLLFACGQTLAMLAWLPFIRRV